MKELEVHDEATDGQVPSCASEAAGGSCVGAEGCGPSKEPVDGTLALAAMSPISDFPKPQVLTPATPFYWDDDQPPVYNYIKLGQRLAEFGDLYRKPGHGSGLLLASDCSNIPPKAIEKAGQLAPAIADRVRIEVFKNGKPAGSMPSSTHLNTMLAAETFLQRFPPLDVVVTVPMYLPNFALTQPGYNDGGPGHRVFFVGMPPAVDFSQDAMQRFLDVMAFASNADRTNTVGAALTVQLRNHWPGAKSLVVVTSTKSHGGKDTIIEFAAGRTPHSSLSYERQDWALQKNFASLVKVNPDLGVINIENVRLDGKNPTLKSAFLERILTDPEPVIFSTGTGDPRRRRNILVLAASTNYGKISEDLMNRALPIHLEPLGDVDRRESPIGNPKLEYLPANRERIEAELRGMIERWKAEGQPLDKSTKHPFTAWARTVGGILQVNGFKDFLGNYAERRTEDDPVRHALGLLGTVRPGEWLQPKEWVMIMTHLGLTKRLIPEADRDSGEGLRRGMGVVLSAHAQETFRVETDNDVFTMKLKKARRRFDGDEPSTRYVFEVLARTVIPEDGE